MERVSIIIPAYNVEKYVSRTIESVLNQTYKNVEIIIINDGSIDNTENIIREYVKVNKNIIYKYQENKGAIATRKEALKYATGEYIMFVDGDDWIEKDCIEKLINFKGEKSPDIIRFLYVKDLEKQNRKIYIESPYKSNIYIKKNDFKEKVYPIIYKTYFYNSMCCQLIKKDIILSENINTNYIMGEDLLFNLELITNAKSIMIINEAYYHYVYNDSSITTKPNIKVREKSIEDVINVYSKLFKYNKIWGIDLYSDVICQRILKEYIIQLREIIISNNKIKYKTFHDIVKRTSNKFEKLNIKKTYNIDSFLIQKKYYYIFFLKEKCLAKAKKIIKKIIH